MLEQRGLCRRGLGKVAHERSGRVVALALGVGKAGLEVELYLKSAVPITTVKVFDHIGSMAIFSLTEKVS